MNEDKKFTFYVDNSIYPVNDFQRMYYEYVISFSYSIDELNDQFSKFTCFLDYWNKHDEKQFRRKYSFTGNHEDLLYCIKLSSNFIEQINQCFEMLV